MYNKFFLYYIYYINYYFFIILTARIHLTPHRKRSSEERRTAIVPSLLTIPDVAPIITGLTESSSSGLLKFLINI